MSKKIKGIRELKECLSKVETLLEDVLDGIAPNDQVECVLENVRKTLAEAHQ